MKLAAIDIGTNAARMLISEASEDSSGIKLQRLAYVRVPLRLGEDVFEKGKIGTKKIKQFTQTMAAFELLANVYEVLQLRVVATSALRDASNRQKVMQSVLQQSGLQIEVISGDEEASLINTSIKLLHLENAVQYVVIDVGGGSTEISVFEHGQRVASRSFDLGTIRLLKNKVVPSCWDEMQRWLTENVALSEVHLIFGTGGNINKTLKLLQKNEQNNLHIDALKQLLVELTPLSLEERMRQFNLKADRADVLVPALQIFIFALEALNQSEIKVPKIGLSEGILYNLYQSIHY
ncbi:MAG: hypothetical protein RLZZ301_848 [Bacteroidota bacterium]|jgi:exopolyphosphatase/guanosine-5'-triphosphate,3'-diphosphate pyrophosphatase